MPAKTRKKSEAQRQADGPGARTAQRATQPVPAQKRGTNWPLLGGAGLLLIVLVALLGFLWFRSDTKPIVVTPTPGPASPLGRISFVRTGPDGKPVIYVVDPDGSHMEQVGKGILLEGLTSWSPDGRYIVAQISEDGVSTIARLTVESDNTGGDAVSLTSDMMVDNTDQKADSVIPAWSPDSSMIAFQSKKEGGNYQIYVMDKDGHNKRRISTGQGVGIHPAWSPDGKTIAYVGGDKVDVGAPKEIYTVSVDGGTPKKLTSLGKDLSKPTWSPDGKQIIYLDNLSDRYSDIMIMNADGTSPRKLADGVRASNPQFNAAGDKILYYYVSTAEPTGSHVYEVPTAGGTPTNISGNSPDDYQPTWSPDGKMVAWASVISGTQNHKIVVAGADGSGVRVLAPGEGEDYQPQWGPPPKP